MIQELVAAMLAALLLSACLPSAPSIPLDKLGKSKTIHV